MVGSAFTFACRIRLHSYRLIYHTHSRVLVYTVPCTAVLRHFTPLRLRWLRLPLRSSVLRITRLVLYVLRVLQVLTRGSDACTFTCLRVTRGSPVRFCRLLRLLPSGSTHHTRTGYTFAPATTPRFALCLRVLHVTVPVLPRGYHTFTLHTCVCPLPHRICLRACYGSLRRCRTALTVTRLRTTARFCYGFYGYTLPRVTLPGSPLVLQFAHVTGSARFTVYAHTLDYRSVYILVLRLYRLHTHALAHGLPYRICYACVYAPVAVGYGSFAVWLQFAFVTAFTVYLPVLHTFRWF